MRVHALRGFKSHRYRQLPAGTSVNHALKLLQLAHFGLENSPQPQQLTAFIVAEQARAYAILDHPAKAKNLLQKAFHVYAADQTQGWRQEQLTSIAGAVKLATGQLDTAATTLTGLLTPTHDRNITITHHRS